MYNSQSKSNFNQFHQRWLPYHSNCDWYSLGKSCLFKKKKENHDAILRRWCSCCLACSWPIYDVTHDRQVYQVCQHEKTYDLRESALRLSCDSKIVRISQQKWTCRETGLRRYGCRTTSQFCSEVLWQHMKPVDFSPPNCYHTTDVW